MDPEYELEQYKQQVLVERIFTWGFFFYFFAQVMGWITPLTGYLYE